MIFLNIAIIAIVTFVSTITLVVVGEETHPLLSIVLFVALVYGIFKFLTARLTKLN